MARFRFFSIHRPARWATALVAYAATIGVLASVHDYPQTIRAISEYRADPYARRPWLPFFYFVNEAGSGIKYELTGDARHFRHFPSSRYFRDRFYQAKTEAENGAMTSQLRLGYYYLRGSGVARDARRAAFWTSVAALRSQDGVSLSEKQRRQFAQYQRRNRAQIAARKNRPSRARCRGLARRAQRRIRPGAIAAAQNRLSLR